MKIISLYDFATAPGRSRWLAEAERIFFASSATTQFASISERDAFLQRWFARYHRDHVRTFLLAIADDDAVSGYLAGALCDPGSDTRFADLGYDETFAAASKDYPAHLHVNIDPHSRSQGIGSALIEAFMLRVAAAGLAGAHLVTNAAARNVVFYRRNGFVERARMQKAERQLVLLARGHAAQLTQAEGASPHIRR